MLDSCKVVATFIWCTSRPFIVQGHFGVTIVFLSQNYLLLKNVKMSGHRAIMELGRGGGRRLTFLSYFWPFKCSWSFGVHSLLSRVSLICCEITRLISAHIGIFIPLLSCYSHSPGHASRTAQRFPTAQGGSCSATLRRSHVLYDTFSLLLLTTDLCPATHVACGQACLHACHFMYPQQHALNYAIQAFRKLSTPWVFSTSWWPGILLWSRLPGLDAHSKTSHHSSENSQCLLAVSCFVLLYLRVTTSH